MKNPLPFPVFQVLLTTLLWLISLMNRRNVSFQSFLAPFAMGGTQIFADFCLSNHNDETLNFKISRLMRSFGCFQSFLAIFAMGGTQIFADFFCQITMLKQWISSRIPKFWILHLFSTKIRPVFTWNCFALQHDPKVLDSRAFLSQNSTGFHLKLLCSTAGSQSLLILELFWAKIRLVFTWNCFALQQDPKVCWFWSFFVPKFDWFFNWNCFGLHKDPNVLVSRTFLSQNSTCFHLKLLCSSLWGTFCITFSPFGCKRRRKN